MEKIVIINAKRTPIGKLNGALKDKSAVELATEVSKALIKTAKIPIEDINQVIFGNAIQAGNGQNIARQIELNSGLSAKTTAFTINQVCGSGLKAIRQAQIELLIGEHKTILAGGTESMSNVPFLNMNQRQPTKFGSFTVYDGLERDGLTDAFSNRPMGITAENNKINLHLIHILKPKMLLITIILTKSLCRFKRLIRRKAPSLV